MKQTNVLVVIAVCLVLVAFVAFRSPSRASATPTLDPKGQLAPDFKLATLDGKTVRLSDLRGHPVVVNFWATWCEPCRIEMPWFVELQKQYGPRGLQVIGIVADDTGAEEITQFTTKMGVNYPVVLGTESVANAYGGLPFLPATFYIDRDGHVVDRVFGLRGRDEIEQEFQNVMK